VGVKRVDDEWNPFPDQGVGYRVNLDLSGVRDLFDAGYDQHRKPLFFNKDMILSL
jgi:hypothetical protein